MLTLQPESPLPLYHQLQQAIRRIAAGHWKPGELIASERELMQLANVSRATVRQALGALIQEGLLERVRGRGTFVARPRFEQEMKTVYSFSEQIRAQGLTLTDRILQRKTISAPPDLAHLLAVRIGETLIHIQRVRSLEGVPCMVDSSYVPYGLCPELLTEDIKPSLYGLLTGKYDLPPLRARDVLESVAADGALAFHLGIAPGAPLMYKERVTYTRNDLPMHVGRNHIRADMVRFRVDLSANRSAIELKPPQKLEKERA